jgi:DNA-binding NtrC family response regulator
MSEPSGNCRILIIEDDDLQFEIYEEALSDYILERVKTCSEALANLSKRPPQVILLDHILSQGELGLDYLPVFKELLPFVPIIVVSGALEVSQQMDALQGPRRAHYCIVKPVDVDELRRVIATALTECGETEVVRQFEALERSRRVDAELLFSRSTDRLTRQNAILQRLKTHPVRPNISALARQFRVARRTIIRDLQELIRRGQLEASVYPPEDEEREHEEH